MDEDCLETAREISNVVPFQGFSQKRPRANAILVPVHKRSLLHYKMPSRAKRQHKRAKKQRDRSKKSRSPTELQRITRDVYNTTSTAERCTIPMFALIVPTQLEFQVRGVEHQHQMISTNPLMTSASRI